MNEARYPSKERVERDGVLIYAEGDDLVNDPDEAERQGYDVDRDAGAVVVSKERVERDGVLIYAEGDVIAADDVDELERQAKLKPAKADDAGADRDAPPAAPKQRAATGKK